MYFFPLFPMFTFIDEEGTPTSAPTPDAPAAPAEPAPAAPAEPTPETPAL